MDQGVEDDDRHDRDLAACMVAQLCHQGARHVALSGRYAKPKHAEIFASGSDFRAGLVH